MISKLICDEYTKCWHVAWVHIGCKLLNCDLARNKIMDQQERVVFSIVPILLLILLLRRARRIRFLLTYNHLDLGTKESVAVSLINRRRQRHRQRRGRRQAWVYPRPQGWFEEMYNNRPAPSSLLERPFQGNTGNIRFHLPARWNGLKHTRELVGK